MELNFGVLTHKMLGLAPKNEFTENVEGGSTESLEDDEAENWDGQLETTNGCPLFSFLVSCK